MENSELYYFIVYYIAYRDDEMVVGEKSLKSELPFFPRHLVFSAIEEDLGTANIQINHIQKLTELEYNIYKTKPDESEQDTE